MTGSKPLSSFQIFSLCVMASMAGLFVNHPDRLSPAYFWLVIVLFALHSASIALLSGAYSRTRCESFAELSSRLLTVPVARLLLAAVGLLFALRAAVTLSVQTDAVALYLLEDTSSFAVLLVLLLTAFFALLPGISRMSGVATLFVLLLPVALIIIIVVGLLGSDWGELRLLYQLSSDEVGAAFIPAALTASGTECALFFLGSECTAKRAGRGAVIAPAVCAAIFACLLCVTVGTIGLGGLSSEAFPLIEASRQISSGGIELTERFDFPLITASLIASIIQLAIYTLCAALALSFAFRSENTGAFALGLLPAEFAAAMLIQYTGFGSSIRSICAWGSVGCTAILFPLLALLAFIRHRDREVNAHE